MQVSACRLPAVWVPAGWGARGKGPLGPEVVDRRQSWGVKGRPRSNLERLETGASQPPAHKLLSALPSEASKRPWAGPTGQL